MSFCDDANFRQQIIDLLYGSLFDPSARFRSNKVLEIWYNLMEKYINYPNSGWIASPSLPTNTNFRIGAKNDIMLECCSNYYSPLGNVFNDCLKNGYTHLGHDVPIWYNSVEGNKRIMIVSQDPRRDIASKNLFLSSPFGLHCFDYRTRNNEVMQDIVNAILGKEHSVYLTDLYKAFALDLQDEDKKSIDLMSSSKRQFVEIFKKEIELYKPDLILLMGAEVANVLLGAKNYNKTIISGPPRKMNSLGDYFNPHYTHRSTHIDRNIRVIPILHTSGNDHGQKKLAVDYLKGNGVLLQTDGIKDMFVKLIKNLI